MSEISVTRDVGGSFATIMDDVAGYLREHHGKLELVLPLRSFGFLSRLQLRRDVRTQFVVTRDATDRARTHDAIAIAWHPVEGGPFPSFTGLITARPNGDRATLTIDGRYRPPLRFFGIVFDATVGKSIASATAHALIDEIARYVERTRRISPAPPARSHSRWAAVRTPTP